MGEKRKKGGKILFLKPKKIRRPVQPFPTRLQKTLCGNQNQNQISPFIDMEREKLRIILEIFCPHSPCLVTA